MKKKAYFWTAISCFGCFIGLILALLLVDRQEAVVASTIGLATINKGVFNLLGESAAFYEITEVLGLVAIAVAVGFAGLALYQWIGRKSVKKVDIDLLLLGGFYVLVGIAYLLFEVVVVNYRPVLIEGELEASFPSSHTMLSVCIFGTAAYQLLHRISHPTLKKVACIGCLVLGAFVAVGRLLSGVHWFTDILGGVLLSGALVSVYLYFVANTKAVPVQAENEEEEEN